MEIILFALALLLMAAVSLPPSALLRCHLPREGGYVAGRMYIRSRGISAEVYTREAEPIDGMSSLWNGGKVTTHADLSSVQLGDMADIYTVEGEHLVLECISITGVPSWLQKTDGDVLVVNGRLVYRLTRL